MPTKKIATARPGDDFIRDALASVAKTKRKAITLKDGQILLPIPLDETVVEIVEAAKVLMSACHKLTMKEALEFVIRIHKGG